MTTNADATLFRRAYDPATRGDAWERVELGGVLWQDERHVAVRERSVEAADCVRVMIPGLHASPAVEDRIMRGIVPGESPPADALAVVSAVRVDFGGAQMHHWEVTAK